MTRATQPAQPSTARRSASSGARANTRTRAKPATTKKSNAPKTRIPTPPIADVAKAATAAVARAVPRPESGDDQSLLLEAAIALGTLVLASLSLIGLSRRMNVRIR